MKHTLYIYIAAFLLSALTARALGFRGGVMPKTLNARSTRYVNVA